ncbi:unnamed protein product [Oreochromis niloticus]|nr:unnamed protein product [Mustela putorius furo]
MESSPQDSASEAGRSGSEPATSASLETPHLTPPRTHSSSGSSCGKEKRKMHRGGKVDKKKGVTVQKEADAEEEIGVSEMVESTEVEERELSLSDLMSILQAHMGQQEDRKQGKKSYDKVKAAILSKYDVNPETYRQRFRSLEVRPDENPKELYARLKDLYRKLIQPKGLDSRAQSVFCSEGS